MSAPPPRRTAPAPAPAPPPDPAKQTWKERAKAKSAVWGMKALDKALVVSDAVGVHANNMTAKVGGERWWPTTDDFPAEVAKCVRILRAFTVDGIEKEVTDKDDKGMTKKRKVFKKIPAEVIRNAKGIVVYTSFRTGVAPFGGAGGSGVIVARLPDGSWSAPSVVAPGNFAAGLMLGVDIFDAILTIMTDAALDTFYGHKVTLGAEIGVAAGTYGAGAIAEAGTDRSPVYSYLRSRGLYAGAEAVAQAYLTRFDENERIYSCKGVTQREILTGHFKPTSAAAPLFVALRDAETGYAQRLHGAEFEFVQPFETKDSAHSGATPGTGTPENELEDPPEYKQPHDGASPSITTTTTSGDPTSSAPLTAVDPASPATPAVAAEPALPALPSDSKPASLPPPPPLPARAPPSTLPPTLPPRSAPASSTEEQREDLLAAAMEDQLAVGEHDRDQGPTGVDEKPQVP
ncbi:hypothetical protein JCM9279_003664 [Rhodotorula babjevae]